MLQVQGYRTSCVPILIMEIGLFNTGAYLANAAGGSR